MDRVLQGWHFMRILRAILAVWITVEAFRSHEWLLLMPAIIFGAQAWFDIGCCGAAGCATPTGNRSFTKESVHSAGDQALSAVQEVKQ